MVTLFSCSGVILTAIDVQEAHELFMWDKIPIVKDPRMLVYEQIATETKRLLLETGRHQIVIRSPDATEDTETLSVSALQPRDSEYRQAYEVIIGQSNLSSIDLRVYLHAIYWQPSIAHAFSTSPKNIGC